MNLMNPFFNESFFLFITVQRSFLAFCLFASTMAAGNNLAIQAVSQGAHLFSTNFVKVS